MGQSRLGSDREVQPLPLEPPFTVLEVPEWRGLSAGLPFVAGLLV